MYSRYLPLIHPALLLGLVSMVIFHASAHARTNFTDQEIRYHVAVDEIATEPGVSQLRFRLLTDDYNRLPSRAVHNFWVAGVPGETVRLEFRSASWIVKTSNGDIEGPYTLRQADNPWGDLPDSITRPRISHLDRFRLVGLYRVEFVFSQSASRGQGADTAQGRIFLQEAELTIHTDIPTGTQRPESPADRDPYMKEFLRHVVSNPSQIPHVALEPEPLPRSDELRQWNEKLHRADQDGLLLFGKLPRSGLYRLQARHLEEAGIVPSEIPADRIRIFAGGDELAPLPVSIRRNRLQGDAMLVFYVPEFEHERHPYQSLWVMLAPEGETARRSSASPPIRVSPSQAFPAFYTVELFEPNEYNDKLPVSGPNLRWATAQMSGSGYAEVEFHLAGVRDTETAEIKVWNTALQTTDEATFLVYINGENIGRGSLRGRRVNEASFTIPPGLLRAGTNTFAIQNLEPPEGERTSLAFLAGEIKVPLTTQHIPPGQKIQLELPQPGSQPLVFPKMSTQRGHFAVMADVTDPLTPRFRNLAETRFANREVFITQEDFSAPNPSVIYGEAATLRIPKLERVDAPRSFLAEQPVDYLAIYHSSLEQGIRPLLDYRTQMRTVDSVTVEDVYAAFSYGRVSYQAIHKCIHHTFVHRQGDRVREILLVGEGSEYWWQYRRGTEDVAPNLLPVYGWADPGENIRGDDAYGLIQGRGPLADVEIGRISVNDNAELRVVVDKIIEYEQSPPLGDWLTRHVFVTDDEAEFDRVAYSVIEKTAAGPNVTKLLSLGTFPYEDYFRGIWRKRSPVMTDRLLEEWNRGAATITYLGHGGPNLWSGERILHLRDVETTHVRGRYPVLVAGSCDTGWVDYPLDPVKTSLAEKMLRQPGGGVVASYIPIAGASSFDHNYLLTAFYEPLLNGEVYDVGTLSLLSKANYLLYRTNSAVTRQYLLMGDPALSIPQPPQTLMLGVSPAELLTLTGGAMRVEGEAPEIDWGIAEIILIAPDGTKTARQRFRITAGRFAGVFQIPEYLEAGDYRLMARASNESQSALDTASATITVSPADIAVQWTTDPPMAEGGLPEGTPVRVTYEVRNDSSINLTRGLLHVDDVERGGRLSTHPISVPAGDSLTRTFTIPTPPGVNAFEARLFHAPPEGSDESPVPIARDSVVLHGTNSQAGLQQAIVGFSRAEARLEQLTGRAGSRIVLPVYDLTDGNLPEISAALRVGSGDGDRLGEPIGLEPLRQEGHQILTFQSERMATPEHRFYLEVLRGDTSSTRVLQLYPFSVRDEKGPNLEVVEGSIVLENENPMSGKTLFVRYDIRNRGDQPIEDVVAELYIDEPWNSFRIAPSAVPWRRDNRFERLDPGEQRTVRIRWDHQGQAAATHTLYATVASNSPVLETDLSNNQRAIEVSLLPPPNLRLDRQHLRASHNMIRPWERVSVTVPFLNDSDNDFLREFRLSAYATSIEGERRLIFRHDFERLLAHESASVQFEWRVQPGEYRIDIDLNEDREYMEQTYDDNTARLDFHYIFGEDHFEDPARTWDFAGFPPFSPSQGILRLPGNRITVARDPDTPRQVFGFRHEDIVEGQAGWFLDEDNLFGIRNEQLYQTFGEEPAPVTFRYELDPQWGTNYYDIYLGTGGERDDYEVLRGHFKYRLNGEQDWRVIEGGRGGDRHLDRMRLAGNVLLLEIGHVGYPVMNHLWRPTVRPVMGIFTSPIVEAERLPRGRLIAEKVLEGESRIEFDIRHGSGDRQNIQWTEWHKNLAGQPVPAPPPDARFFQWRARLIETPDGVPTLKSVKFEVPPRAGDAPVDQVAEVAGQPAS